MSSTIESRLFSNSKAELLIHLFARELFLMQKLEIEKTKPTSTISVLKVEY